eukprot:CAMPEP_0198133706 /NCGR_PEP_ID=MMETSP1442-20131203/59706_1 /TAXON_ID= /ORGANISM="Craspedostauros australis, Strain CCMP3328" /LENGTH=371 /DNA_ID=CAMNT_0043794837 /DNA_START=701 /DNA_END=1816 /DNA_ORIENTATION=+
MPQSSIRIEAAQSRTAFKSNTAKSSANKQHPANAMRQQLLASSTSESTIFYNIFIPPNQTEDAMKIVAEQLAFRQTSYLRDVPLHYVLIAPSGIDDTDTATSDIAKRIQSMPGCEPCTMIRHVADGNEELTLTQLHEHCQHHPSHRVVYIHSKGTYHPTLSNDILRRLSMRAVTSKQCNTARSACNVCSAHFSVYPFFTATGNFFVAQCQYVQQLLPPTTYRQRKDYLHGMLGTFNTTSSPLSQNFTMTPQHLEKGKRLIHSSSPSAAFLQNSTRRKSWIGVGRNAMEHWVHSHPNVQPCDVHPTYRGAYVLLNRGIEKFRPTVLQVPSMRTSKHKAEFAPWFQLEGRLLEWEWMYNAVPNNDSWIYGVLR